MRALLSAAVSGTLLLVVVGIVLLALPCLVRL